MEPPPCCGVLAVLMADFNRLARIFVRAAKLRAAAFSAAVSGGFASGVSSLIVACSFVRANDPSSATRPASAFDCNRDAMAGFAAAHG